jgi:hypothetical protein
MPAEAYRILNRKERDTMTARLRAQEYEQDGGIVSAITSTA